ncbi:MAG TPA: lipase maturation factor family protein [Verrucomicrobiae bacterium]|nr:lipase maturation factor family protein [Verrucomicrobiae bacterium]
MRSAIRVANPPQKPLLIYDGDCHFCTVWIRRWRHHTGDHVEYIPFQAEELGERYPELPRENFEGAVHLVEPDGSVFSGAEAAFRAFGYSSNGSLLLDWYQSWPSFGRTAEACYRFVAKRRTLFSILTRIAWGEHVEPAQHILVRELFTRGIGVIYFIAFTSLWMQVIGLIGNNGILPANLTMFGVRQEANAAHMGLRRYHQVPTFCWISATDASLKVQCAVGTCLSVLVILGLAPAPCLFLLWLIYLSLATVSREFLSFQWDSLLLETGLLAVFFAPLRLLPGRPAATGPSKIVLWLLRWLLFRLMLGSGLVKLLSGDPVWRNLTALKYHYETQPLPTWSGWYAHQLPAGAQRASALLLFIVELAAPFLVFAPRRLRLIPFTGFILLQILIMLTGNYCFFNLLSILLCFCLLDDFFLERFVKGRRQAISPAVPPDQQAGNAPELASPRQFRFPHRWPIQVTFPLMAIAVLVPVMQLSGLMRVRVSWPSPLLSLYNWVGPLRSFNNYGLFAVMTTNRFEIVVQGSNDGTRWLDYEFKYKPGDPKRRPGFVEPHQPRLDWQMWFAALGDYRQNLWFVEFCARVLNGSPEVLGLLRTNPFPKRPPKYIRAVVYQYHFTDRATRKRTGAWWRREPKGDYMPILSNRVELK